MTHLLAAAQKALADFRRAGVSCKARKIKSFNHGNKITNARAILHRNVFIDSPAARCIQSKSR
jgi:hypothetical protein